VGGGGGVNPYEDVVYDGSYGSEKEFLRWKYGDFSENFITYTKLSKLLADLDEESVKTVTTILCRLKKIMPIIKNIYNLKKKLRIDFFTSKEKKYIRELREDYSNNIIQIAPDCFCYKNYFLPINAFSPSVFYDKHGLRNILNIDAARNKDIIDVGGYIGDSLLILCPLTRKNVYTFETVSENFNFLEKTIIYNNLTNVKPFRMALGSGKRTVYINGDGSGATVSDGGESDSEKVEMNTLDNIVEQYNLNVGLIKVDIEGAEQDFLKGAMNTIRKYKPILLLSIYHSINDFFEIKPIVESWNLGYRYKIVKPMDGNLIAETLLIAEHQENSSILLAL
jgi:FkbM family methyltransferase